MRGVIGVIVLIRLGFRVIQGLGFMLRRRRGGTTPFHLAKGVVTQNGGLRHRVWLLRQASPSVAEWGPTHTRICLPPSSLAGVLRVSVGI